MKVETYGFCLSLIQVLSIKACSVSIAYKSRTVFGKL
jgi:hypothetical protein